MQLKNMQVPEFQNMRVSYGMTGDRTFDGVIIPEQVHGTDITMIETGLEDTVGADGVITSIKNLKIGVLSADCAAICLADGEKVAAIHAGWRGSCSGIIEKALSEFNRNKIEIWVAPMIEEFEIQRDDCYELLSNKFGQQFFKEDATKIIFEFKRAVASLLPACTKWDNRDTYTNYTLPSYRRNCTEDRIVTIVERI